ncbi:MAG TPA: FecR domain-containing protein [Chitinophagaceae bacterium]|jgi:ferric-dicitrate binding protein FerR (iron transport regulator)|nr:FecR domain-containing protein [Chitinophagaceae bacterium]
MEMPEHIWFLMSRNLSGEATSSEQEELARQLQAHPQWQQQYETLRQLWKTRDEEIATPEPAKISRILQLASVEETLQEESPASPIIQLPARKKWYRYAAVAVILIIAAWSFNQFVLKPGHRDGVVIAQKGTKTRTILPDGSIVWLNAGSRIEYDPSFNGQRREVKLFGEAYFDVVKNPARPFIVHAGGIDIKVLGTAFNVKSYPEEDSVETTLIHGLVELTRTGDKKQTPIYLRPNQKIVLPVAGKTNTTEVKKLSTERIDPSLSISVNLLDSTLKENERFETAWMYNRLEFRGDSFLQLARKMERWYNIIIHFEDEAAKALMFNGSIENESVEQAFKALQTAVSFNYKIENNEVYVSSK